MMFLKTRMTQQKFSKTKNMFKNKNFYSKIKKVQKRIVPTN